MHERWITRQHRGCLILLVDQSRSMSEPMAGSSKSKIDAVISSVNRILQEIIFLTIRDDDEPINVVDISVIGYSTNPIGQPAIEPILQDVLSRRVFVSNAELFTHPQQIVREQRKAPAYAGSSEISEIDILQPLWCKTPNPAAMGGSPICAALNCVAQIAQDWASSHRESYPPVVIHLTDGESTDGDPESAAAALKSITTEDGELLLFHTLFLSSQATLTQLPTRNASLPNHLAAKFFRLSSSLPLDAVVDPRNSQSHQKMQDLRKPRPRGLMVNADPRDFVRIFKIGTEYFPHWSLDEDGPEPSDHDALSLVDADRELSSRRCPCCDRKAMGRPGQRFCIVCERSF